MDRNSSIAVSSLETGADNSGFWIEICDARGSEPKIAAFRLNQAESALQLTVGDALLQSGIAQNIDDPIISRKGCFGVFGIRKTWDAHIYEGDRLELYAKLLIDPMHSRRKKANQGLDERLQTKARERALSKKEFNNNKVK